jgi:hypothetical protein
MKIKKFNENFEETESSNGYRKEYGIDFHDLMKEKMKTVKGYVVVSYSADDDYANVYQYETLEDLKKDFNENNGWITPTEEFMEESSVNENECYLFIDGVEANG